MKAKDLLKIDFSKYKRVQINGITMQNINIVAEEFYEDDVSLEGFVGQDIIFRTFFSKNRKMDIVEIESSCLVIKGREGRDETN